MLRINSGQLNNTQQSPSAFRSLRAGTKPLINSKVAVQETIFRQIPHVKIPPLSRTSLTTVKFVWISERSSPTLNSASRSSPPKSPTNVPVPLQKPIALRPSQPSNILVPSTPNQYAQAKARSEQALSSVPNFDRI